MKTNTSDLIKTHDEEPTPTGPAWREFARLNKAMSSSKRSVRTIEAETGSQRLSPVATYEKQSVESYENGRADHQVGREVQVAKSDDDPSLYITFKVKYKTPFEGSFQVNPEGEITPMLDIDHPYKVEFETGRGIATSILLEIPYAMDQVSELIAAEEHERRPSVRVRKKLADAATRYRKFVSK